MNQLTEKTPEHCPCGTGKAYLECCGAFISNLKTPSTPEELMRSRYTAYCLIDIDYIGQTMKSPAADDFDIHATTQWAKNTKWTKLDIIQSSSEKSTGIVEFIAHCIVNNKKETLHEISQFHRENGKWYYVDGILPDTKSSPHTSEKIGRNDPCVCKSGKKYKKCCGKS